MAIYPISVTAASTWNVQNAINIKKQCKESILIRVYIITHGVELLLELVLNSLDYFT